MLYILWIYIGCVILLDRLTKSAFSGISEDIPLIGHFVRIHSLENTGISFGIGLVGIPLLVVTAILTVAVFTLLVRSLRERSHLESWGYASIFAGAVSNGFDRFAYGSVRDFLAIEYFAICNVADIVISIGALLLVLAFFWHGKPRK